MVEFSNQYAPVLERGIQAYDEIIKLYTPEKHSENDYAAHVISEAMNGKNSLLERLANKMYLERTFTSNYFLSIMHFLDSHWDDYREYPIPDSKKFKRREEIHKELNEVMNEIIRIHNKLKGV